MIRAMALHPLMVGDLPGSSPSHSRDCIIVLGMHRSGTSALARVLNLLGVDLGTNLLPAAEDNETGFWEHRDLVLVNEEVLRHSAAGMIRGLSRGIASPTLRCNPIESVRSRSWSGTFAPRAFGE